MELMMFKLLFVGGVFAVAIVSVLVALVTQRVVGWMRSPGTPHRGPITSSMDRGPDGTRQPTLRSHHAGWRALL
jgi:hypothetical protein